MRRGECEPGQEPGNPDGGQRGAAQSPRTEFAEHRPARTSGQHDHVALGLADHVHDRHADRLVRAVASALVLVDQRRDASRHDLGERAGDGAGHNPLDRDEEHRMRRVLVAGEHLPHLGGRVHFQGLDQVTRDSAGQLLGRDAGSQAGGSRERGHDEDHLDGEPGGEQAEARQRDAPVERPEPCHAAHDEPTSRNL